MKVKRILFIIIILSLSGYAVARKGRGHKRAKVVSKGGSWFDKIWIPRYILKVGGGMGLNLTGSSIGSSVRISPALFGRAEFHIIRNAGVTLDIKYKQSGFTTDFGTARSDFLEMDLYVDIKYPITILTAYGGLGLFYAAILSADFKALDGNKYDIKEYYHSPLGFILHGGAEMTINKITFFMELAFSYTITKAVSETHNPIFTFSSSAREWGIHLFAGAKYRIYDLRRLFGRRKTHVYKYRRRKYKETDFKDKGKTAVVSTKEIKNKKKKKDKNKKDVKK